MAHNYQTLQPEGSDSSNRVVKPTLPPWLFSGEAPSWWGDIPYSIDTLEVESWRG